MTIAAPGSLEALELFVKDAYLENGTVCRMCGYRTELGAGHIHNDACLVGKAEAAISGGGEDELQP